MHRSRTHDKKSFSCEKCSKSVIGKETLNNHMRKHNSASNSSLYWIQTIIHIEDSLNRFCHAFWSYKYSSLYWIWAIIHIEDMFVGNINIQVWTGFAMLLCLTNIQVCTRSKQLFTPRPCLLVILIFKFELDLNNYSHRRHFKACIEASQSGRLMFRNSFNPRFPKYDEKVQNNQFILYWFPTQCKKKIIPG